MQHKHLAVRKGNEEEVVVETYLGAAKSSPVRAFAGGVGAGIVALTATVSELSPQGVQ